MVRTVQVAGTLLVAIIAAQFALAKGAVHVRGYFRSNGTYVQPHSRSAPDGVFSNNWSTYGNVNPYTGEAGSKLSAYRSSSWSVSGGTGQDDSDTTTFRNAAVVGTLLFILWRSKPPAYYPITAICGTAAFTLFLAHYGDPLANLQMARWLVFVASIMLAEWSRRWKLWWELISVGIIAVVYNPIIPLELSAQSWTICDRLGALLMVVAASQIQPSVGYVQAEKLKNLVEVEKRLPKPHASRFSMSSTSSHSNKVGHVLPSK